MLILGSIEDALSISEEVFSGVIADGNIKMHVFLNVKRPC